MTPQDKQPTRNEKLFQALMSQGCSAEQAAKISALHPDDEDTPEEPVSGIPRKPRAHWI